jgi:uncharacterized protein DUF6541
VVRHGLQQGASLTIVLDLVLLALGLLVPGWCVMWLLLKPLPWMLALPTSMAMSMAIVAVAAWVSWLAGLGLRGVVALTVIEVAACFVALGLKIRKRASLAGLNRVEAAGLAVGGVTALVAIAEGPWLSQNADTFYHLAAARSLLRTGDALPHDIFFGVPVAYPDTTTGSLHIILAWLSLVTGMVPAWAALTAIGAAFVVLSFIAFAREVTRSMPVALIAGSLYVALWLNFDMRTSAYPNRIGPGIVWLSMVFLLRYARAEKRSWRELVAASLLAFTAVMVHSGMGPYIVVLVSTTFGAAAVAAVVRRRPLRSLFPLAVVCGLVLLAVLPVLVVRILGLPGPGPEGSFATEAPPIKVRVLFGYPFLDFRFWFDGVITLSTVGTVCLLGRSRRLLFEGDGGAALLWGGLLVIPAVCLTPVLTNSADGLYYFARVADLLKPLVFVTIAWELWAAQPRLREVLNSRAVSSKAVPALAVAAATLILLATYLPANAVPRFVGDAATTVSASRHNDLTGQWSDRLGALDRAGPGAVLADLSESYELAGLTGRRVVAVPYSHTPYQDEPRDGILRRGDVIDAMNPASPAYVLPSVLLKYGVTFVMVDRAADGQPTWDAIASRPELVPVASGAGWRLLKFEPARLDADPSLATPANPSVEPRVGTTGRAIFVRVLSAGVGGTATVTATGSASGAVFKATMQLPSEGAGTATAVLLIPDGAPVDRYSVDVALPDGTHLIGGNVILGRTYEAESFANVIDYYNQGYYRLPGWESVYGSQYSRGAAAIGVRTSVIASHPLVDPPGDYCVTVRVVDSGTGRDHSVRVQVGDGSAVLSWSDKAAGAQELRAEVRWSSGAKTVAFSMPAGSTTLAVVDSITLGPPPTPGDSC